MAEGFATKPTVVVGKATKKSDYDNLVDFVAGSEWLDGDAGYTFVVADFGKTARVNAAGAQTVNLPSVAAANIGGKLAVVKLGAGNVTIQAADNDSIADGAATGTLINSVAGETFAIVVLELATATKWIIVAGMGTWATSASTFVYGKMEIIYDLSPELGGEMDAGAHTIGFTAQTATGDGTTTIDWRLGNKMHFTHGAMAETFTFTAPTKPCNLIHKITQDGVGGRDCTFPGSVTWLGAEPTWTVGGANKSILVAYYWDGTTYWAIGSPWEV